MGANFTKATPASLRAQSGCGLKPGHPDYYDYLVKVLIVGAEPDRSKLFSKIVNLGDTAKQNFNVTYITTQSDFSPVAGDSAVYKLQLWGGDTADTPTSQSYWQFNPFQDATIILVVAGSNFGNETFFARLLSRGATEATVVLVSDEGRKIFKTLSDGAANGVISYSFDFDDSRQLNTVLKDIIDARWAAELVKKIGEVRY